MSTRRVVVTGRGAVSPVGLSVQESWASVLAGQSGICSVSHLDAEKFSVRICGTVKDFQADRYIDHKDARKMDGFIQYALVAAMEAVDDSGLMDGGVKAGDEHRYGVVVGSGVGGLGSIESNHKMLLEGGPRRVSPFFIPAATINMAAGWLSMKYNLQGPNFATSTACASGSHALALAARTIAYGDADVMIAGGTEKASSSLGLNGFAAARALSTRNDEPTKACRPWDKDRDGFVLGDGSAILVLEEYEHAVHRGAHIYAELTGVGMSSDAFHMTSPPGDGRGAARAMRSALSDAGIIARDMSYINAHGTATRVGDIAETQAIYSVYGEAAEAVPVSSTKSMTGHLLGAAGALEAIFSVKVLEESIAPPTINLDNPDEGCGLDYIPNKSRVIPVQHVMSNSFGFGGTNVSLIFSRID